jgi:hypothetical protein
MEEPGQTRYEHSPIPEGWKEEAHKHLREQREAPPRDCGCDPRRPPRPRPHLRMMAISGGACLWEDILSFGLTPSSRDCYEEFFDDPATGSSTWGSCCSGPSRPWPT